mmetsp:Transcript_824/g.1262  ORF Transcript_824/g.1262 Transcript_824/m.1262 type:complete len:203 (+) Transcript_824:322-930(+)
MGAAEQACQVLPQEETFKEGIGGDPAKHLRRLCLKVQFAITVHLYAASEVKYWEPVIRVLATSEESASDRVMAVRLLRGRLCCDRGDFSPDHVPTFSSRDVIVERDAEISSDFAIQDGHMHLAAHIISHVFAVMVVVVMLTVVMFMREVATLVADQAIDVPLRQDQVARRCFTMMDSVPELADATAHFDRLGIRQVNGRGEI